MAACLGLLAWLAAPPVAATGARTALALGIALAGGAVALAGSVGFRRARTTVNPLHPERASALVTRGIYRHTRNPMYVGMTLALSGFVVWLGWWPALLAPVVYVGYITRFQIQPEERALAQKFGPDYAQYCRQVRRWL